MKATTRSVVIPVVEKLPPIEARVIVVSKESRCLGYLDKEAKWRDALLDREIKNVIGWSAFPC